jgi:hypothetical protein
MRAFAAAGPAPPRLVTANHPNPLPVGAEERDGERGRGSSHHRADGWAKVRFSLSPFVFTNGERVGARGGRGRA